MVAAFLAVVLGVIVFGGAMFIMKILKLVDNVKTSLLDVAKQLELMNRYNDKAYVKLRNMEGRLERLVAFGNEAARHSVGTMHYTIKSPPTTNNIITQQRRSLQSPELYRVHISFTRRVREMCDL